MTTTDVHMKIVTSDGGIHHAWADGFTDNSETEIKIRDLVGNLSSIGDALRGKTISMIQGQPSIGSILERVKIYSPNGGLIGSWRGGEILNQHHVDGLKVKGLDLAIVDGMTMKITTQD